MKGLAPPSQLAVLRTTFLLPSKRYVLYLRPGHHNCSEGLVVAPKAISTWRLAITCKHAMQITCSAPSR